MSQPLKGQPTNRYPLAPMRTLGSPFWIAKIISNSNLNIREALDKQHLIHSFFYDFVFFPKNYWFTYPILTKPNPYLTFQVEMGPDPTRPELTFGPH